jgi:predicted small metal-binding protein
MQRMIKCECGYVARGDSDDEVVVTIEQHIKSDHPELVEKVSREDIQGWVQVVS